MEVCIFVFVEKDGLELLKRVGNKESKYFESCIVGFMKYL